MSSPLLEYPPLFDEKLKGNRPMRGAIDSALALATDMLQVSKLPFFPDYTDHGIPHLTKVLAVSAWLIPEASRDVFTAEDAAVLTFAVLLHDLALHLSEAGFATLLQPGKDQPQNKRLPWPELWSKFLSTAKHWDERKLIQVFGADEAGAPLALVRDPFHHYGNLSESDRKLIGEFIRQNHARMAYEFAIHGFPGRKGEFLQFGSFVREYSELAGIVALSHGLPLRDSLRRLDESQIDKIEYDGVHPVFLMGVLRVADFLDLGPDRAPLIAFALKDMASPLSRREFATNQAFRRISWGNPDAESIHIPARPADIGGYLELKRWLTEIQAELDMTWAVFGEVYRDHTTFSRLKLAIRRVRSNILDDPERFREQAAFVPRRVELSAAGADVIKLLIKPLYGDHPEIGVRELVQNAVDAVRERWEFEKNHPDCARGQPFMNEEADVVVWLDDPGEDGKAALTVSDNGIGMTEDIVENYFLRAGASFRQSMAWKEEYEEEEEESAAGAKRIRSRVLRSGRFGIGVLAAFLLGNEIEVSTRHVAGDRGIRFSLRLGPEAAADNILPIQLNYDAGLPIGTSVKIRIGERTKDRLLESDGSKWDWYCLESPSVLRIVGRERRILPQRYTLPPENAAVPPGWRSLPTSDFRTVHAWVSEDDESGPRLVCNGIRVEPAGGPHHRSLYFPKRIEFPNEGMLHLRAPRFSIFDPAGNLPLDLQRTGLTNQDVDCSTEAFQAQAKSLLAMLLTSIPAKIGFPAKLRRTLGLFLNDSVILPLFLTKAGMSLLTPANLDLARVRTCLLAYMGPFEQSCAIPMIDRYDAVLLTTSAPNVCAVAVEHWISGARLITTSNSKFVFAEGGPFYEYQAPAGPFHLHRTGKCPDCLLQPADINFLIQQLQNTKLETISTLAELARKGELPEHELPTGLNLIELFLKDELPREAESGLTLSHYWKQIIREPVIPFDLTERRQKLSHAYEALRDYIADFANDEAEDTKDDTN